MEFKKSGDRFVIACVEGGCGTCPFSLVLLGGNTLVVQRVKKRKSHHITRDELRKFYTYLKRNYKVAGEGTKKLCDSVSLEKAIEKVIDEVVKKALKEQMEKLLISVNEI